MIEYIQVRVEDLERYVSEIYQLDFTDESRHPGLEEVLLRGAVTLDVCRSKLVVGDGYYKYTMAQLAESLRSK